jgi:hypothetical protein
LSTALHFNTDPNPTGMHLFLLYSFLIIPITSKSKKVKLTRYTPRKTLGVREGIARPFLNLGTRRGWVVNITPRRASPRGQKPRCLLYRRLCGPQSRLGAEGRGKIFRLCRGSNPSRPLRSQSLYWLSYPALNPYNKAKNNSECQVNNSFWTVQNEPLKLSTSLSETARNGHNFRNLIFLTKNIRILVTLYSVRAYFVIRLDGTGPTCTWWQFTTELKVEQRCCCFPGGPCLTGQ